MNLPSILFRSPLVLAMLLSFAGLQHLAAITPGQADTFQDGMTANWMNGGTVQPQNISTGGPAGNGDRFMELTADGSGTNGRLTVFNRTQWLGNYVSSGVNEIDLDLNNFSNVTLSIRLAFKSGTFGGAPGYVTTTAFTLAPNSGWQHATFSITAGAMTGVGNPSAFATFFTAPAEFRVINASTTSDLNGDAVIGQLGIDNIIAVPEADTLVLVSTGIVALTCWIRRGKASRSGAP
ncbi:MAG: hypothetical protein ACJ8M1_09025 [Chthoniobacterales bacterium]